MRPLRSLVPDQFPSATSSWPELNVAEARKLLTAEGYCNGNQLQVPFTFRSNVPTDQLVALTWQEFLSQELGDCLVLEPTGLESATLYEQLEQRSVQHGDLRLVTRLSRPRKLPAAVPRL